MFLVDFVVVDIGDTNLSLILGRPLLNTSKAIIDVLEGTFTLRVDKEHTTFNFTKCMKFTHAQDDIDFDEVEFEDVDVIASVFQVNGLFDLDALDSSLSNQLLQESHDE